MTYLWEKFLAHVNKGTVHGGCWMWTHSVAGRGLQKHGYFYDKNLTTGTHQTYAHRLSWKLMYGDIPSGYCVLHRCDVPRCVNPLHLFLGTNRDNIKDRHQKGRSRGPSGERSATAKLSSELVTEIRRNVGRLSQRQLARKYGVSQGTINHILSNRTWKHVVGDADKVMAP